ncbi:MAG: DUF192 domain-containing protein [Patescibacteria group bacterium]
MKYLLLAATGFGILIAVWLFSPWLLSRAKQPVAVINGHELGLQVVRTPEEQSVGLSGRESLAENAGMLFVYKKPFIPGFWMPDMRFSIDIIWIDKNRKIVGIEDNVAPQTYPDIFQPSLPVLYVLEVNANWAKNHNISIGDEVMLTP